MCTPNYTRRDFLKVVSLGASGLAYGLAEASLAFAVESNSAKTLLKKQTAKTIYDVRFPNNVFPFGTHVYREPHQNQDELMADLPLLKKLGFNMIKIQEHWGIDEKKEGEIDLSRIERVIAKAKELNLGVYLGLTMEQAPAWMWKKYPDCRLVYASGLPHNDPTQYCMVYDGKPGPCWDHPGARTAAIRFITKLVKQLARFENIWVWNTWQEIGFRRNDGKALGFCYCPHTLKRFREWLKIKYGSLRMLNKTWQTGYGDWDEVEPPRRNPACSPFIDWRYFMDDVYLTRVLQWKTKAIRENDPLHRPIFSHVDFPKIGSGAEWRWARVADFYGNSNYLPSVAPIRQIWEYLQFWTDYCRCAAGRNRIFWGAEFQGGPGVSHTFKGSVPTAEDTRRWMLAGLAGGMNGISFWNHRSEIYWQEGGGYGLLDANAQTTDRIEEAARIGRAINREPEIFSLGKPPKADVAIIINENLYHFCEATGGAEKQLKHGIQGYYYRFWRMGTSPDFVEAEDIAAGGLDGYKLVVLPVPLALDAEFFGHLRYFVEKGGMLVSDACPGRWDKYGFCPRTQMVVGGREVFGAKHKNLILEKEGSVLQGVNSFSGTKLQGSFYLQVLTPTSAQPILEADNKIAGTLNCFGKGKAILLGTFAGHSALDYNFEDAGSFFEKILAEASVKPDRCGQLLRRRRVCKDRQAWFLINPTEEQIVETICDENFKRVHDLLGDGIVKQEQGNVTVKVPAGNLCCLILSK